MNILIIGGTRFMGPVVVRRLVEAGHTVTVFHRGESLIELPGGVNEILGDRNQLAEYKEKLLAGTPDVVVDMFALTRSHAEALGEVFGGAVRKAVIISSGDVYRNFDSLQHRDISPPDSTRLTEESPLRTREYPHRHHTGSDKDLYYYYDKIHVEQTALAFESLPVTILRLPMVYGPGDRQHRLYSIVKRMYDKRPGIVLSDGEAKCRFGRSFVDNAAEAIVLAALSNAGDGQVYNVSEPVAFTERQWIDEIAGVMGWQGKIVTVPNERLPEHLRSDLDWRYHLDMDSSKIRNELGFEEMVAFEDGLRATIEWELAHPPEATGSDSFDYAAEDAMLGE